MSLPQGIHSLWITGWAHFNRFTLPQITISMTHTLFHWNNLWRFHFYLNKSSSTKFYSGYQVPSKSPLPDLLQSPTTPSQFEKFPTTSTYQSILELSTTHKDSTNGNKSSIQNRSGWRRCCVYRYSWRVFKYSNIPCTWPLIGAWGCCCCPGPPGCCCCCPGPPPWLSRLIGFSPWPKPGRKSGIRNSIRED